MSKPTQQALSLCLSALFTLTILGAIDRLAQTDIHAAQMAMKTPAPSSSGKGV